MKPFTDQELIEGLKMRNNHVVQFMLEEYLPMIEYMIEKMGGGTEDAKDIFQEALIILIIKIDKGEFVLSAKFSTYLYAISKKLLLYQRKKQKVATKYSKNFIAEFEKPHFTEKYDKELKQKIFKHYFDQLSEVCQNILKLYWLELPIKEIASKLGKKEGYIRTRKSTCKKKLIELIINNPDKI
ncbi:MAG: sigma-70 family RNA polymerase sigma factor [Bacteroidota bacterium]